MIPQKNRKGETRRLGRSMGKGEGKEDSIEAAKAK